ncbi:MMPL family transporter [Flavobacterium sp. Fl-77]|uniref:MMPL family transporter n=1 Tax=Flavobacterium flavipigmentatum TaxID=2893884 RepID=A0AAJ2SD78_9FLAO|nr:MULTISPECIES: MMPL family transporter [unclassified Flavobacterium]MDX6180609.1 MMPL family transporter [Flavobacterium sp. Fl-33]MDX6184209.1 MMPL family transporter [Flavobacterium sp. Fl-77]UFH39322.1 MMPL family transporter [Flavobacterium sp. F-70]
MKKTIQVGFWEKVARIILKNRITILVLVALITIFLGFQWKNLAMSYTEANLLPKDHIANKDYQKFLDKFGEEGNLIVIGFKDPTFFTPKNYAAWNTLMTGLKKSKEVDLVVSLNDLKKLEKDTVNEKFVLAPFINQSKVLDPTYLKTIQHDLFYNLPFYEGLLFNKESGSIRSAVYINKDLVNTAERKTFILENLVPKIDKFEKTTGIDLRVSGMPYIRTINANNMKGEIALFIGAALFIVSLIFFFFFRSFRATFISVCILVVGVIWSFGTLGLLHYKITILTAIIPPLIIVIGITNCIFLINKYQQEIKLHNNQAKALQRIISKIGVSTLMTNLTTAIGFATFMITGNELLFEFGLVTSINVISVYILTLLIVPIVYSFMSVPGEKHLYHLTKNYISTLLDWVENIVKNKRRVIYTIYGLLLLFSVIGISQMKVSGSLIGEMPRSASFFKDILFYEKEFNGVMPLEIMIDTKRKKGVMKLSTMRKMDELQNTIASMPELSKPVSIVNLVKYSKQAFYNGKPEYYQLPTSQEQTFILSYAKNATKNSKDNLMKSYVDSTGQYARITTFMKDIGTDEMAKVEKKLHAKIDEIFPSDRYEVTVTGKALVFQKGTSYLVGNLIESLIFAIFVIAVLMLYLFRSFKMVFASVITNILPLCITSGLMGYFGIPLKPSTILVFSIAFGISVDNAIQFMAKYRHDLLQSNGKVKKSIFSALRETGISTFYTSVVLILGFATFTLSSFSGTIALGGLISCTLAFAMFANLLVLPALVLTFEKKKAKKEDLENLEE